jgi:hypothetical protein
LGKGDYESETGSTILTDIMRCKTPQPSLKPMFEKMQKLLGEAGLKKTVELYFYADAAIVIAKSTALADACATALGNRVFRATGIPKGLAYAEQTAGIDRVVVIIGDQIGAWGNVQLVKTSLS